MATKKRTGKRFALGLIIIAAGLIIVLVLTQIKKNSDSVDQAFSSVASLQSQFDRMSNKDIERFCYEIWKAEMNGCSAENADLDKLVKDHPAEMEVLSEEIFYQSVPEQVMDYWPKWFSVSIPNADSQYRRQPFIYQKVNDNDNQKHFSGPMSYYTAIQTKYEVQIVHFVSKNEAVRLTSCKIPEGMEFIGIAHGGYLLFRDEQGIEQIQISNSETVNFDIWKAENSYDKANYYVES